MRKQQHSPLSSPALPPDKIAERLRAHARLCRQVARESWDEAIANELSRIAEQCMVAAAHIEPEPHSRLH